MPVPIAELDAADWARLNTLLARALDLPAEQRLAWATCLDGADARLGPLLEQLLLQPEDGPTTRWLAGPPSVLLEERAVLPRDLPGSRIGPYRLVRELGHGGMGTVWLAVRDDGVLDRRVALKLPLSSFADSHLFERMARERALLAGLNHPNIAQLYDAGYTEGARPYLALEYVEGQPIDQWCRQRQLSVAERIGLLIAIARAVGHAHAQLVVHRDLKPGNVLVTDEGVVKLLDFGVAKLLLPMQAGSDDSELTRRSGRPMTLSYAAPEQVIEGQVSTAADIYSLGVMAYELLSGARPYEGHYAHRHLLERAVVEYEPPLASQVAADRQTARRLRGDLDTIIAKALKKSPAQRYDTAMALADDLQRYLQRLPVIARPDSTWYRLCRFAVRNRIVLSATTVAVGALLAGLVLSLWQAQEIRTQGRRAEAIYGFVLSVIQQGDPAASQQTRQADLTMLSTFELRLEREFSKDPQLRLPLRLAIATAYRNRGEFELARRVLRRAVEQDGPAVGAEDLDLLRAKVRLVAWPLVDARDALQQLDGAVAAARRAGRRAASVLAEALLARWMLRLATGDATGALDDASAAQRVLRDAADPALALDAAAALAATLGPYNLGRPQDMLAAIEAPFLSATASDAVARGHPSRIGAQALYGQSLVSTGRAEPGLALVAEAVRDAVAFHGPASHTHGFVLSTLGEARLAAGDLKGSLAPLREAHAIAASREPAESLHRAAAAYQLSWVLAGARRPFEARAVLDEAEPALLSLPEGPLREGRRQWHQWRRAELLLALEEPGQAIALIDDLLQRVDGRNNAPLLERLQLSQSRALVQLGEVDRAARQAAGALERRRAVAPQADHRPWLVTLAHAQMARGNHAAVIELADAVAAEQAHSGRQWLPLDADAQLLRGQALIGRGRAPDAVEPLRRAHAYWLEFDEESPWGAEVAWWLAMASDATGDGARGRQLRALALPRLARSPLSRHRELAASAPR